MSDKPVKIGVIGCGTISHAYFKRLPDMHILELAACADLDVTRARQSAEQYGIPWAGSVEDLLANDAIELVLNLTTPQAHRTVAQAALNAGKHVYNEKPLTATLADGKALAALAAEKKLLLGCAPDTFMGAGIQCCIKLIRDGWIGQVHSAAAFVHCPGHERWHPDPAFYYKTGGGPMLDWGPYYVTALVAMLGPVGSVAGNAAMPRKQRIITSEPKRGQFIDVEVPTYVNGLLNFTSGVIGTITTSYDVWASQTPRIEIYGTRGTLCAPDPNGFGGPVKLFRAGFEQWADMPLPHAYAQPSRGVGLADMASAIRSGRMPRANGTMALHVLEIMESIENAAQHKTVIELDGSCDIPEPMPMDLMDGQID